jgi:archaellum biogenesis ATPase FlaH
MLVEHLLTEVDRLLTIPLGAMVPGFKRASLEPGPLCDLIDALHELHLVAGQPSTGDLQRDMGGRDALSRTAIHNMFAGSKLPSWRLVEPLVQVMARRAGGRDEKAEVERFRALWAQVARPANMATEPGAVASAHSEASKPEADPEIERLSRPISFLLVDALDEIEAVGSGKGTGTFRIPTGFADLDALLGGWSQGCLIIAGGRPSSGKTTLLLNFCRTASIKYRLPSMLISGEMNSKELEYRLLSAEALVPLHSIRTGQMDEQDWGRLAQTMTALAEAPIHLGSPAEFLIEQLSADATRLARESELKLLLIDSLQWITDGETSDRVSVELTLRRLKTLAETLKIPIIVTAHAERRDERLSAVHPIAQLTHYDAIERVADVVIILRRPDQDDRESPRAGEADLMVAKNRNGPTATATVAYQYHYCRFIDMAWRPEQMIRAEPSVEAWAPIEIQATAHDRELFQRLLEQIPSDGQVIDWLRNNFMLKAQPLRHFETVTQVAKMLSLQVIGFDDKEADDRYNELRAAIDSFCDKIPYYTRADPGNHWLEIPNTWRDREDREQYNIALSEIGGARNAFVEAYDKFVQTCHKKAIDRNASSED